MLGVAAMIAPNKPTLCCTVNYKVSRFVASFRLSSPAVRGFKAIDFFSLALFGTVALQEK